ncbi:hypothetical protein XANCAGTX0491_000005 [Xanthoria calcicola]
MDTVASVASLLLFIAFAALNFTKRFKYGGGRHTWDLPPEYYNGHLTTGAVGSYMYVLGTLMAKLSLLLFLYRIFRVNRKFRIATWALGFMIVVWSLVSFLLMIFSCRPIKANWNPQLYLDPKTRCYPKSYNVLNIHGYCNVISDFALLFLPIPMLWKLQMTLKKKMGLATIFATGLFICAVAITRQYILYNTPKAGDNWEATRNRMWMSIEFSLAICVACLPVLAPFFKRIPALASLIPSIRSRFTSRSHGAEKDGSRRGRDIAGSRSQTDVERGNVPGQEHKGHSSWHAPRGWQKQTSGEYELGSQGSQTTLQPVLPTYRELRHKD